MTLSNIIYSHNDLNNKNGIGIENAKKRLDLIYKHNYKLTQNQNCGKGNQTRF